MQEIGRYAHNTSKRDEDSSWHRNNEIEGAIEARGIYCTFTYNAML